MKLVSVCKCGDGMDIELDQVQRAGPDHVMLRHVTVFFDEENVERDLMRVYHPDVVGLVKFVFRLSADSVIVMMLCRCMEAGC